MNNLTIKEVDKLEITKESKKDIQRVLDGNILPQRNHTVFEVNLVEKTIVPASFDRNLTIHFNDALDNKKSISKKKDCIYISSLNVRNVKKILKRDHNLIF